MCTPDKCGIRSNDNTALRVATAKAATKALVALIDIRGQFTWDRQTRRRIVLSALQTIRAAILSDDGVDGEGNALKLSRGDIAAKQAALGPYLKLHAELGRQGRRLRRCLAKSPILWKSLISVAPSIACRTRANFAAICLT